MSNMMICTLLLLGLILAAPPGDASASDVSDKWAHHGFHLERTNIAMLTPEEFPIIPWGWTAGDEKALKDIKDCGFNLAGFVAPQHVKLVEKAGLRCIVDDPRISNNIPRDKAMTDIEVAETIEACVKPFRNNPTVYGYYMKDEPTVDWYPNLARWRGALAKVDPDAVAYINLLPIGAQGPGVENYEQYLERFATEVKPVYISYDHYTVFDDGSMRPSFFQNLEVVRKTAQRHGIPFWNIILSNAHFRYAKPTQGTMNIQVFGTLAYGGRGLSYFTYFAPLIGNYRDAPIDQFMNKTPTWDMIRILNQQIHTLGPTYMKLKSVNVFHNQDVPRGCSGMETSRHLAEINGGNFLVGEFIHEDGRQFVMVVNKDIHTSAAFGVKFKKEGRVMLTNSYTGQTVPWQGENNWLAPGQGMLLSLEK